MENPRKIKVRFKEPIAMKPRKIEEDSESDECEQCGRPTTKVWKVCKDCWTNQLKRGDAVSALLKMNTHDFGLSDCNAVLSEAIKQVHKYWRAAKDQHAKYDKGTIMKAYWHGEQEAHLASLRVLRELRKRIKEGNESA